MEISKFKRTSHHADAVVRVLEVGIDTDEVIIAIAVGVLVSELFEEGVL